MFFVLVIMITYNYKTGLYFVVIPIIKFIHDLIKRICPCELFFVNYIISIANMVGKKQENLNICIQKCNFAKWHLEQSLYT